MRYNDNGLDTVFQPNWASPNACAKPRTYRE